MIYAATFTINGGNIFWRAFVMTRLWGWFVVPLGLPAIGIAHAIGLSLLFGVVTLNHRFIWGKGMALEDTEPKDHLGRAIAFAVVYGIAWGIGAIAAEFMA